MSRVVRFARRGASTLTRTARRTATGVFGTTLGFALGGPPGGLLGFAASGSGQRLTGSVVGRLTGTRALQKSIDAQTRTLQEQQSQFMAAESAEEERRRRRREGQLRAGLMDAPNLFDVLGSRQQ